MEKEKTKEYRFKRFFAYSHISSDYVLLHSHDWYELSFYEKGKGNITVNGDILKYEDMSCVVIAPDTIHDEETKEDTYVYCLSFSFDRKFDTKIFYKNEKNYKFLKNILNSMKEIKTLKDYYNKHWGDKETLDKIETNVNLIIVNLIRMFDVSQDGNISYQQLLIDYIKKTIDERLSTFTDWDIIAEKVGYSSDRIRKLFKFHTGESLYKYITNKRLFKAKKMLKNKNEKICDIAKACGFNSEIRFSLFFKERMDISPAKYRKIFDEGLKDEVFRKN